LWAGGVAQVVECLPSKPKALSSNPSITKKKKREKKKKEYVIASSQCKRNIIITLKNITQLCIESAI
jgi:hypothetical protein